LLLAIFCCPLLVVVQVPTKVFALPMAMRLYRNRQGLSKGKKGKAQANKNETAHKAIGDEAAGRIANPSYF
jgi:hypothetical protein